MSFLRGFLSSPTEVERQQGGLEAIEKLCERLETATLLDDRRDAIRALRALSKTFQVEVGTHAMDMLINVIKEDSSDFEITEMIIETLLNVMASKGEEPPVTDLGVQFTEIFVKSEDNVCLLLSLLEEYEFHVRWPTVKLLILLLKNKSKELQDRVLEAPMGISKLMDLLSDSREIIRNDGLLLMIKLTKNNPNIQKIVAFENAFERLLHIVSVEGNSDGGIIVEDCLSLLINLLRSNLSNQNFFRETSNIQRIAPFFEMPDGEEDGEELPPVWNMQKQKNILLMLQILQVLISPTNNPQSVIACQKVMYTRGIYMRLMDLILYPNLPADIFAKLVITIGDIIRGNDIIQQFMDELTMSERPAILLILMFMVNDKQPFATRLAAYYCVRSFLFKNAKGQAGVVTTLLPNHDEAQTSVTSGQLLCAGLFSSDPIAHWVCSLTLANCLYNNPTQRENMLMVQLELTPGLPPVSLINQVFHILTQETNPRTRFGTLMLLLVWVKDCNSAVSTLLSNPDFVPLLLEMVEYRGGQDASLALMSSLAAMLLGLCLKHIDNSCTQYSKETLLHLITHRVGVDSFNDLLDSAGHSPLFTTASKSPHPTAANVEDLALEFNFTKFYKKQIDVVSRALSGEEEGETENHIESHDQIVNGFKDLIKQQDEQIQSLKDQLNQQPVQVPPETSPATTPLPEEVTGHISQLEQYAKSQEQYYTQYIAQLQNWYNEQLSQLQQAQSGSHQTGEDLEPTPEVPQTRPDPEHTELEERFRALRLDKQQQDQYVAQLVADLDESKRNQVAESADSSQEQELREQLYSQDQEFKEKLSRQEQEFNDKLARSQSDYDVTRNRLIEIQHERDSIRDTLSSAESEILSMKGYHASVSEENTVLRQQIGSFEEEKAALLRGMESSEGIIEALHSSLREKTGEMQDLEKLVIQRDRVIDELEIQIAGLKNGSSPAETQHDTIERDVTRTEENVQKENVLNSVNEDETPVVADKTPVVNDDGTPVVAAETPVAAAETPVAAAETPVAAAETPVVADEEPQLQEPCYDYSEWFTPVVSDDGITYYQSQDGHYYSEEQYKYTIAQYDAYYRQQAELEKEKSHVQDAAQQATDEQTPHEDSKSDPDEETVVESGYVQDADKDDVSHNCDSVEHSAKEVLELQEEVAQLHVRINELEVELELTRDELANERKSTKTERETVSGLVRSDTKHHDIEGSVIECHRSDVRTIEITGVELERPCATPDTVSSTSTELTGLQEKYECLNSEQEDLLVLLAHQDRKISALRARLLDLGEVVAESESEDDFDDLMASCEDLPRAEELTVDGRVIT